MDELDKGLNETFDGKVLRKDLLHRIKKGTNVPTFVLEFLLAKYCASNDQAELDAGACADARQERLEISVCVHADPQFWVLGVALDAAAAHRQRFALALQLRVFASLGDPCRELGIALADLTRRRRAQNFAR